MAMVIVVMGVSGSGKSTFGALLARRIGASFFDADGFHPPANVEKMSHGIPLTDVDRQPWLAAMAEAIRGWVASGTDAVLACSALKRTYRDGFRAADPNILFIHLAGAEALIAGRMAHRSGHFMPVELLRSQFATLEPPDADEGALTLDIAKPAEALVEETVAALRRRDGTG